MSFTWNQNSLYKNNETYSYKEHIAYIDNTYIWLK